VTGLGIRNTDGVSDALVHRGFERLPSLADRNFGGFDGLAVFHSPTLDLLAEPVKSVKRTAAYGIPLLLRVDIFQCAGEVNE
jgi:hypothetical protein